MSTLAVGADGGGLIRIPAAFTGVFGIKPSYGLCQDENGLSAMSDFISPGPFAWHVADAREMLGVLADRSYRREPTKKELRIAWCARPGNTPHDPNVVDAVSKAVNCLVDLGHHVVEHDLDLEGWKEAFGPLVLDNERRERSHLLEQATEQLTGYERRSLEAALKLRPEEVALARSLHAEYRARIQALFTQFDLLVLPTTAVPAFPIKQRPTEVDEQNVHWLWGAFPCTAPFNVAGNPAASLPCGFVDSLPVGVQLVGAHLAEELLLNVAEELETALAVDNSRIIDRWR